MTDSTPQPQGAAPKKYQASQCTPLITDQTTKLLALAEQVAHFGSWEWDVSKSRAVWSPELFHIFGIEPRSEGLTAEEYQSFIHPDDLARVSKRMQASMTNVHVNQKSEIDYRIIRTDGSIRVIHSQRQVRDAAQDGKLKVIVGVDQDVTEEKQAEEALRRSEERFRAVAEAANVLVYESDLKTGKVHIVRGEKELVGYETKDEDRNIEWLLSRMHPDDVPKVVATWNEAKNNPNSDRYVLEYRLRHKSGGYIIVKDTAKAVKDRNGVTVLFIGGVRDISQRRLDQEQIKQYSKRLEELVAERTKQLVAYERLAAIGQMAGMVGHDIRNPLQALIGEVYLIKAELGDIPQCQAKKDINEGLDNIEQNIAYINKIVADLQDYSRQLKPEIQPADLKDLIVNTLSTIALPKNLKLIFNIGYLPEINIDPTFTRRALTNLVNNAIQAMPEGGELKIDAHTENTSVNLTIADTGVGIPEEVKAKLFTPMFTTKAKGQGLGLAVVKRLVEAQGGSISFESTVGKGTKFVIKLPLNRD